MPVKSREEAFKGWVYLINVADEHEADLVESILLTEGIPVQRKHREGGDYMAIYMGMSRFGIDLFVPEDKLEVAEGLLKGDAMDMPEEAPEDDTAIEAEKYEAKRRGIVWIILMYLFLPVIAAIILNYIIR